MLEPETLLHLPRGASTPCFSPDGTWLAYEQDGVWVRDVACTGPARRVGDGRAPCWLPAGDALLVLRSEGGATRVWRQPLAPDAEPTPVSPEGVAVQFFALAADGRTLALVEAPPPREAAGTYELTLPESGTLWLLDLGTGEIRQQVALPPGELASHVAWSPDGRYLALQVMCLLEDRREALQEVRLFSPSNQRFRRVVPTGACQTRRAAWRPDSQALALAASPHPYGFWVLYSLATWNLVWGYRGAIARYLTRDPLQVFGIAWAPDGETIYVSARNAGITNHLYAVSLPSPHDGTVAPPKQLTSGLAHHTALSVSPDGLAAVLAEFDVQDPWDQVAFLLSENIYLDDDVPLDELKRGRVDAVRRAARAYGEHGAP